MNKLIDLEKHISITSAEEVKQICNPLFQPFDFISFRYVARFKDNSFLTLCSHKHFTQYFFEEGHFVRSWVDARPFDSIESGIETIPINRMLYGGDKEITDFLEKECHVTDALDIIIKDENSYEHFSFGANHPSLYCHSPELFKRFILYFKEKAQHLIKQAHREKMILPSHTPYQYILKNYFEPKAIQKFIEHTPIHTFYLDEESSDTSITSRELTCLYWATKGKAFHEIGTILGISKRTVEKHIEHLKLKLNCHKLSELTDKIHEKGLFHLLEESIF